MTENSTSGRLLIHIGFHRTGTTFLQHQVFNDPQNGFISPVDRHLLRDIFISTSPFEFEASAIRQQLNILVESSVTDGLVPVLSHEQLSGQLSGGGYGLRRRDREVSRKEVADRLFSCFPEARILIVIREQKEMIRSIYKYLVCGWHGRLSSSINQFLDQSPLKLGYSPLYNLQNLEYHWIIQYYQNIFGIPNVLVLPYELLRHDPVAFVNRIRLLMNMKAVEMVDNKQINSGKSATTCQIRRSVNQILVSPNRPGLVSKSEIRAARIINKLSHFIPGRIHASAERALAKKIDRLTDGFFADSNKKTALLTGIDLASYGYEMPFAAKPL